MKRILSVIILLATLISLAACGNTGEPKDPTREFTLVAVDQSSATVAGVGLTVLEGTRVIAELTTDGEGEAKVVLYPGKYTVRIDTLPEGQEAVMEKIELTLDDKNPTAMIPIKNNIPNGTEQRPFVIDGETEISQAAGKGFYYRVVTWEKKTLCIRNAEGLSVTYQSKVHTVNSAGMIVVDMVDGVDTVFIRAGGKDVTAVATLEHPFGTAENPHTLRLGSEYRFDATGKQMYYKYIAESDGALLLTASAGEGSYVLRNLTTGETVMGTGACEVRLLMSAGDEIILTVSGEGEISYTVGLASAE